MENIPCMLYAYEFTPSGKMSPLEGENISQKINSETPTWAHFSAISPDTGTWLKENVTVLDQFTIDSLLEEETRPRIHESNNGMLIILRCVNLNKGAEPEDMISIRLWIDGGSIISTERRPSASLKDIIDLIGNPNAQHPHDPADFLVLLLTRIIVHMEQVLTELLDQIDLAEEAELDGANKISHHELNHIRKEALILRRYFAPQKDVISHLITSNAHWLDTRHKRQLYDSLDRITRYIEDLDIIRERAQMVKEEMAHRTATKMNKNMFALSVISAIFMPMSFLTGLLGSNIGGIPGSNYAYAFWIVCGLCGTFALLMLAFFKRKKWL